MNNINGFTLLTTYCENKNLVYKTIYLIVRENAKQVVKLSDKVFLYNIKELDKILKEKGKI